ncbi:MAG: hypothetical protein WBA10_18165 [Elainellaceae cyanobacterium]
MSSGILTASIDAHGMNSTKGIEPAVPISVDAVGELLLDAIEDTDLVEPGVVPLIDASTDPEAIAFSATVLTILDATDADDGFTEPTKVVGLVNDTTDDILAMGFADPLTGELFAIGISGDLVTGGVLPGDSISDASTEPVYVIADASPVPGLSVFIFSNLDSGTTAILEPSLDVRPNIGSGFVPGLGIEAGFVMDAATFSPSALLAPDVM